MSKVAGRKKRIIGTTAALVAISGGAAFAYWTATGTGSATTKAGTTTGFEITGTATGGELSPGGPTQKVTFTVKNPGTGVQKVSKVDVKVANTDGTTWTSSTGCKTADFAIADYDFTAKELEPGGTATGTVTLQMVNSAENQDGCKGATVPLHFAAS
ncbi:hypothetical protein [Arthrobacter sp. Alg241-R88]|uniref:hypothetical protein n=1 Tax=Arthrobacter sp. Alg241-R88 TaxID=2305984 RepID=UPI0013D62567|nr:hypothetical protein [Arthrobacter sp. Alg241-R88]